MINVYQLIPLQSISTKVYGRERNDYEICSTEFVSEPVIREFPEINLVNNGDTDKYSEKELTNTQFLFGRFPGRVAKRISDRNISYL